MICKANFYYAHRHANFDPQLEKEVQRQDKAIVENLASQEARKLNKLHTNVGWAVCKLQSFLRFETSKHGILYTKIKSEHKLADIILEFFHLRFPLFHIVIEHGKHTYVIDRNGDITKHNTNLLQTVSNLEKELPVDPLLNDIDSNEEYFQNYYQSQNIKERYNPKLMKQLMPKKYMADDTPEHHINTNTKSLNDYF